MLEAAWTQHLTGGMEWSCAEHSVRAASAGPAHGCALLVTLIHAGHMDRWAHR